MDKEEAREQRRKQEEREAEWKENKEPEKPAYRGPVKGMEKAATFDESWQPEDLD